MIRVSRRSGPQAHTPAAVPDRFCLGLDLGRQQDHSALAVLRWPVSPSASPAYDVPMLRRWPLGTSYRAVAADVVGFLQAQSLSEGRPLLVIDQTGVGDAVFASVVEALGLDGVAAGLAGVTVTGGGAVTSAGGGRWRVARKELASVLQVLLVSRRLRVAPALPEARTLAEELAAFTVKVTDTLNETFEVWRERPHDDLVLAVALAVWAAETPAFWNDGDEETRLERVW
jgi:hypothetical protein